MNSASWAKQVFGPQRVQRSLRSSSLDGDGHARLFFAVPEPKSVAQVLAVAEVAAAAVGVVGSSNNQRKV